MGRLGEKGPWKAPRRNNAGNRSAAAYRRVQAAKVRTRQKPGMTALREIRKYPKTSEMLIQKAPFQRLVREFIKKKGDIRVTLSVFMACHESSDAYLAEYFQDVNPADIHSGRVKIKDKDFAFVRSIRHEDIFFNPSTPEGIGNAHVRQAINKNKNTAGLDAMRQLERGIENQTRLAYVDTGPSQSAQGSARHGGGDVAIGFARGKPTGVTRGTTPLSSKPNQEAVRASIASVIVRPLKPHSNSSSNKKDKQKKPKKKKRLFSTREMDEPKMNRDSWNKTDHYDMETDEETLFDLDKTKSSKIFEEIASEMMQQKGYIHLQQQDYAPADLEIPVLNDDP
jgi:histone H3/H4